MKNTISIFLALSLFLAKIEAQRTITGTIYLENEGEAIGASVIEEEEEEEEEEDDDDDDDENINTATEFDGTFSFDVPQSTKALKISYTGYLSQVVSIKDTCYIEATLSPGEIFITTPYIIASPIEIENNTGCSPSINAEDISSTQSVERIDINTNSRKNVKKKHKRKRVQKWEKKSDLKIIIPTTQNLLFSKPPNKDDFFEINFEVVLHNTGKENIKIVDPFAYRIFPHTWIVKNNKHIESIWSGSITCAPFFSEQNIRKISSGDSISFKFNFHELNHNFFKKKGNYQLSIKYSYSKDANSIFLNKNEKYDITKIESEWSNEVIITIN